MSLMDLKGKCKMAFLGAIGGMMLFGNDVSAQNNQSMSIGAPQKPQTETAAPKKSAREHAGTVLDVLQTVSGVSQQINTRKSSKDVKKAQEVSGQVGVGIGVARQIFKL